MCENVPVPLVKYPYVNAIHQPQYRKIEEKTISQTKNKKIENRKRVFTHFTHSAAKNQYRSILHMQITLKPIRKKIRKISIYFPGSESWYLFV
jgi:hypothetical protein